MHLRPLPFLIVGIIAASAMACGSSHGTLFAASGTGGSAAQGTGGGSGAGTTGSGGTASTGSGTAGSTSSSGTTTSSSTSGGWVEGPFPPPPQVVSGGGPVLTAPELYPVFFSNDDAATVASLADFTMNVGGTPYWTAATSEYGVGAATGHAAIKLAEAAPAAITDAQIQQWLATKFATAGSGFPAPTASTLIVLYYPTGTSITLQNVSSCVAGGFGGYHSSAAINGQQIAYAVVPRCGNLDSTTGDASHELVEAATDAHPLVDPAYVHVDDGDVYWQLLLGGGEVGDMCAQFPNVFTKFAPFNYTVQRTWSNKAAAAGHDPCVPQLPGEVYFNAAPVLPDLFAWNIQGQTAMIKSVSIPVGGTKTIPIQLFSDGPIGPWTVTVTDPAVMLGAPSALLDLSLDKSTGKNGDTLQLTIKVLGAGTGNAEVFIVKSTLGATHFDWFAAVSN